MEPITEILKQAREEKHLTPKDVAMIADIPVSQYQKYESGDYNLLFARMDVAHKVCHALDIDPSSLIDCTPSVSETPIKKAVLYASFPKGAVDISTDGLKKLASVFIDNTRCTIIDTVIDEDKHHWCSRREKWLHLMQRCENGDIDILIVPSITMLGYDSLDALKNLRNLRRQHDQFDAYFLYEEICASADCFDERITFYLTIAGHNQAQQRRKAEFRKIYKSVLASKT